MLDDIQKFIQDTDDIKMLQKLSESLNAKIQGIHGLEIEKYVKENLRKQGIIERMEVRVLEYDNDRTIKIKTCKFSIGSIVFTYDRRFIDEYEGRVEVNLVSDDDDDDLIETKYMYWQDEVDLYDDSLESIIKDQDMTNDQVEIMELMKFIEIVINMIHLL